MRKMIPLLLAALLLLCVPMAGLAETWVDGWIVPEYAASSGTAQPAAAAPVMYVGPATGSQPYYHNSASATYTTGSAQPTGSANNRVWYQYQFNLPDIDWAQYLRVGRNYLTAVSPANPSITWNWSKVLPR